MLCQEFSPKERINQQYQHKRSGPGNKRGQIEVTEATMALHACGTPTACMKSSLASWLPVMDKRRSLAVESSGTQGRGTSRHVEKAVSSTVGQLLRIVS